MWSIHFLIPIIILYFSEMAQKRNRDRYRGRREKQSTCRQRGWFIEWHQNWNWQCRGRFDSCWWVCCFPSVSLFKIFYACAYNFVEGLCYRYCTPNFLFDNFFSLAFLSWILSLWFFGKIEMCVYSIYMGILSLSTKFVLNWCSNNGYLLSGRRKIAKHMHTHKKKNKWIINKKNKE